MRGGLVDLATLLLAVLVGGISAVILDLPWWGAGLISGAFCSLLMLLTWQIRRKHRGSAP